MLYQLVQLKNYNQFPPQNCALHKVLVDSLEQTKIYRAIVANLEKKKNIIGWTGKGRGGLDVFIDDECCWCGGSVTMRVMGKVYIF